jgi:hypothetical protein
VPAECGTKPCTERRPDGGADNGGNRLAVSGFLIERDAEETNHQSTTNCNCPGGNGFEGNAAGTCLGCGVLRRRDSHRQYECDRP